MKLVKQILDFHPSVKQVFLDLMAQVTDLG